LAKKRRQKVEKKDDYDFKLPDFDEHQFIGLELRKAKVSLIAFIFAILMVIVTFQLYTVTFPDSRGPIVLGIFSVVMLPIIVKIIKVDVTDFDWKNWIGVGAIYVMSWLAIFILVCNPPFSDFIDPDIDDDKYLKVTYQRLDNGTWLSQDKDTTPPSLISPIRINISTKITDNSAIDKDSVILTIKGPANYSFSRNMESFKDNYYRVIFENNDQLFNAGDYTYTIEAKDIYNHKQELSGKFRVPPNR
jgi:hypothetical protein